VWDFVNRVAQEVGKTHPHKLIYCCAYGANSLPPTNIDKLEPNVQVVLVGGRRPKSGAAQQAEIRAFRESWLPKTDRPIQIYENYPLTNRGWYLPCFMARTIGHSINETKGVSRGEEVWISPHREFDGLAAFDAFQFYFTARMYWGGKEQNAEAVRSSRFGCGAWARNEVRHRNDCICQDEGAVLHYRRKPSATVPKGKRRLDMRRG
jgi:hypothetical protein